MYLNKKYRACSLRERYSWSDIITTTTTITTMIIYM
jgi:hypothetical protein